MSTNALAPGARILCRNAEWLIKSVTTTSDRSRMIEAVGVSEFIRGRSAQFIEELESDLEILRPEETKLVHDHSSGYRHSVLFLEAHLKQTTPDEPDLYQGHLAAMDLMDYQLWPAFKTLQMPRQRILIADAVGLGKTLECGILVAELIRRGRGRRILVVTTKAMMVQFQKEFWSRFTIPLVRLDSTTIQKIRTRIPGNHNPFHYYDRSIISVDTLKQDREYRSYLEKAHWDIIIIDEAHNVAVRGKGQSASQRAKLANRLSTRSDTLILLSATPHDGRPKSFASLMNMLDPTAIANEENYSQADIRDLYVRRFKKDVLADLKQHVPERNIQRVEAQAGSAEERVFELLNDLTFQHLNQRQQGAQLFKTTLLKAMLSSPAACLETVKNRMRRLQNQPGGAIQHDLEQLEQLHQALEQIDINSFSKYQALLDLIQNVFQWRGKDPKDRLVIFTGRIETLKFLQTQLTQALKLKPEAVVILDGSKSDVEQNAIVEAFGQEQSPVRILIATEVASEGLNLHYLSHKLIHFDIPWSLMTLQQRNGRIDRYGQQRQPEIRYLLTRSKLERMDEVERIIKVLLDKDEQAIKNIGDPSVFMGVFDPDAEEAVTAQAIETGTTSDEFSDQLDTQAKQFTEDLDLFALFANPDQASPSEPPPTIKCSSLPSLFASTFDYVAAGLQALETPPANLNINPQARFIELYLPPELARRYDRLPPELRQNQILHLTDRPNQVMAAMEAARREEAKWPTQDYLWELHPLVEWLTDRCLFRFGRHQAPVIHLSNIPNTEAIFILFGSFPNRRGAPVLTRWVSVVFQAGSFSHIEPLTTTLERTQLGQHPLPNRGEQPLDDLLPLRQPAIHQARHYLQEEQKVFTAQLNQKLAEQQARLEKLRNQHIEQINLRFQDDTRPQAVREHRQQQELDRIQRVFQDHQEWVELSMTTEPEPFIKLVTVLRGE